MRLPIVPLAKPSGRRAAVVAAGVVLSAAVLVAIPAGSVAHAQDTGALQARIERLERELRDLERDYYRGGKPPSSAAGNSAMGPGGDDSNLSVRMTNLEESLRNITGQLEQLSYRVSQLEAGGKGAAGAPVVGPPAVLGSAPPPANAPPASYEPSEQAPPNKGVEQLGSYSSASTPPSPTAPAGDENAQFAAAVDVLYRGDNEGGAAALQSFVTQHPKSAKAGEAYYWLGEAQLARKAYREAGEAFLTTVQKYPKDPKAPQALVKLGSTLIQGGQKTEGCKQLKTVKSVFPKATQQVLDMAARERARAGCK